MFARTSKCSKKDINYQHSSFLTLTLTQRQTPIVNRSIERFYKPVRPAPQTWSSQFAELSNFLLYSTMRVLQPEAKKHNLSIVQKSIHMRIFFSRSGVGLEHIQNCPCGKKREGYVQQMTTTTRKYPPPYQPLPPPR